MRRIVTSQAYQAPMAATPDTASTEEYVYRGPIARRMTAEQFIDGVWQLTGTAPGSAATDVLRMKVEPGQFDDVELQGQWIWTNESGTPPADQRISFRKTLDLATKPSRAWAVILCQRPVWKPNPYANWRRTMTLLSVSCICAVQAARPTMHSQKNNIANCPV